MREIDFVSIVVANKLNGIFEHGHHAKAEQIDFDDAHVGAIFFVPLHDDAAWHGSGFEGDDGIELSLADNHAARVLAEMTRHVLHGEAEFVIFAQARVGEVESCVAETAVERIVFIAEFPGRDSGRNSVERFRIESERLAHLSCGHTVAISDDVGGHRSAALAVSLVNVLDHFFALIAAGEIEINVGPLSALFGKETLEEKFHADGIDGGNAERIADGAVGSGSASLNKNIFLAAVADKIPDDEEVSSQLELLDECEFFRDLQACFGLRFL